MSYAEDVGAKLRRIRQQRGMSLQDVERASDGYWKAAVVGSYERGDRNITASKLCELADFYDVSPVEVLPADDLPRPLERSGGLVIDISRLDDEDPRWEGLRRFCESIQLQRGDYNRHILSLRGDDVRALSVILDTTPDQLVEALREADVLLEDR